MCFYYSNKFVINFIFHYIIFILTIFLFHIFRFFLLTHHITSCISSILLHFLIIIQFISVNINKHHIFIMSFYIIDHIYVLMPLYYSLNAINFNSNFYDESNVIVYCYYNKRDHLYDYVQ